MVSITDDFPLGPANLHSAKPDVQQRRSIVDYRLPFCWLYPHYDKDSPLCPVRCSARLRTFLVTLGPHLVLSPDSSSLGFIVMSCFGINW
ncbi:hypothetical protein RvY_11323-2 [Ramazzottius varieornatus]|uniref:Uncharacterized protein n=1 Tax=Ramazzottius varieornatus TaxID=947166 RepID=A0A1D1VNH4_RAMVA|nr:hypothetical protein RvY_11323-2 [Ramazzottius varieornatus]